MGRVLRLTVALGVAATALVGQGSGSWAADVLIVGPGKVGGLRMGQSTQTAKNGGWISRDTMCGSWSAGPKTYRSNRKGEVFKAYPVKIRDGRVLSMWATGEVVTAKGVRADSLQSGRKGSTLATVRDSYPNLKRLGWWAPGQNWGLNEVVYTTGSKRNGWLDFYVDANTNRVSMMLARHNTVKWTAFKGADGC